MSFRNPFVTDFIYQSSDEARPNNAAVTEVFEKYARHLAWKVDERGYGYYAGTFSSLDGSIQDIGLEEIVRELQNAAKHSFRMTVLLESGPVITYEITNPNQKN